MFKLGTGWLGWSIDQVFDAPLPQLFLAVEGKVDYLKKTNPFGGGAKKKAEKSPADIEKINEQRLRFSFLKAEAAQKIAQEAV